MTLLRVPSFLIIFNPTLFIIDPLNVIESVDLEFFYQALYLAFECRFITEEQCLSISVLILPLDATTPRNPNALSYREIATVITLSES